MSHINSISNPLQVEDDKVSGDSTEDFTLAVALRPILPFCKFEKVRIHTFGKFEKVRDVHAHYTFTY